MGSDNRYIIKILLFGKALVIILAVIGYALLLVGCSRHIVTIPKELELSYTCGCEYGFYNASIVYTKSSVFYDPQLYVENDEGKKRIIGSPNSWGTIHSDIQISKSQLLFAAHNDDYTTFLSYDLNSENIEECGMVPGYVSSWYRRGDTYYCLTDYNLETDTCQSQRLVCLDVTDKSITIIDDSVCAFFISSEETWYARKTETGYSVLKTNHTSEKEVILSINLIHTDFQIVELTDEIFMVYDYEGGNLYLLDKDNEIELPTNMCSSLIYQDKVYYVVEEQTDEELTEQLYCLYCKDGESKLIMNGLKVPDLICATTDGKILLQQIKGNYSTTRTLSLIGEEGDEMIIWTSPEK